MPHVDTSYGWVRLSPCLVFPWCLLLPEQLRIPLPPMSSVLKESAESSWSSSIQRAIWVERGKNQPILDYITQYHAITYYIPRYTKYIPISFNFLVAKHCWVPTDQSCCRPCDFAPPICFEADPKAPVKSTTFRDYLIIWTLSAADSWTPIMDDHIIKWAANACSGDLLPYLTHSKISRSGHSIEQRWTKQNCKISGRHRKALGPAFCVMSRRRKVTNSCVMEARSDLCESCAFKADTLINLGLRGKKRLEEAGSASTSY